MDTRRFGSRGLGAVLALAAVLVVLPALSALADEECYFDPTLGLVCEDDGEGGGGGTTTYWTSWQILGLCGGAGGVGGVIIDLRTNLILAFRDRIEDGEVVQTQTECLDLSDGEDTVWEEVATAIHALPPAGWESDPDRSLTTGLTGLETRLWYSSPTQVGPIDAIWVEPVTGIEFGVRGRGWIEAITWTTGEADYDSFATEWEEALLMGGSPQVPAAAHVYRTASRAAGYAEGYPVTLDRVWVGQYQVMVIGGAWTSWARFSSTLSETVTDTYPVVEVRSRLSQ